MASLIRSLVLCFGWLLLFQESVNSFSTSHYPSSIKTWNYEKQHEIIIPSSIIRPLSPLRKKSHHKRFPSAKGSRRITRWMSQVNNNNNNYNNSTDVLQPKNDAFVEDAMIVESSSSSVVKDGSVSSRGGGVVVPSYWDIVSFVSYTVLIWLSEPLLSLVDTTTVGRYGTTVLAAALGPATLLIDNLLYSTYFLSIATTVQMASARANSNFGQMKQTCQSALTMATIIGSLLTITVGWQGRHILQWILRSHPSQSSLLSPAHAYCLIRGSVATFSVISMVAQSICLSVLDTQTPAKAVILASILNILLDLLLVPTMGLSGAALATATASLGSCFILCREIRSKLSQWNKQQQQQQQSSSNDTTSLWSFVTLAGPISLVIFGKLIGYSSMTLHATQIGTISTLACHNIMLRVFFFFCTFGDALSQATQSFLPPFLSSSQTNETTPTNDNFVNTEGMPDNTLLLMEHTNDTQSKNDSIISNIVQKLKKTILPSSRRGLTHTTTKNKFQTKSQLLLKRLMVIAIFMGIFNTQISYGLVTSLSGFFTRDIMVQTLLEDHVPWLCSAVLVHPVVMALEGSILATGKVFYLVGSYVLSVGALLYSLQYPQLKTLTHVWKSLFYFQMGRMITFFASLQLGKQTKSKKKKISSSS